MTPTKLAVKAHQRHRTTPAKLRTKTILVAGT